MEFYQTNQKQKPSDNSLSLNTIQQNRSISIYGSKTMNFASPNKELLFAKSYNQKIQNASELHKKKENAKPINHESLQNSNIQKKGSFISKEIVAQCSNSLNNNFTRKFNSPTFSQSNPILQNEEHNLQQWKSSSKKTQFSDKTVFKLDPQKPLNSEKGWFHQENLVEKPWKSSSKRIELKNPKSQIESERVKKKQIPFTKAYQRDPIVDGDPNSIYTNSNIRREVQPSKDYQTYMQKKHELPSRRQVTPKKKDHPLYKNFFEQEIHPKNLPGHNKFTTQSYHQSRGSEIKNLLNCKYAPKFREQHVSSKPNEISVQQRSYVYKDLNDKDFRKKKDYLEIGKSKYQENI